MKKYTKYIAWLDFVGGILWMLGSLVLLIIFSGKDNTLGGLTMFFIVGGALFASGGYGLLKRQPWGWWMTILTWTLLFNPIVLIAMLNDRPSNWNEKRIER